MLLAKFWLASCSLFCLTQAADILPAKREADASAEAQLVAPFINDHDKRGPPKYWRYPTEQELWEVAKELAEAGSKLNITAIQLARAKLWNLEHPMWAHNLSDPNDVIIVRRQAPSQIPLCQCPCNSTDVIPKFQTPDHQQDLWRTIFRVMIDKTGPDPGRDVELHALVIAPGSQRQAYDWTTTILPKMHSYKTDSKSDDGLKILEQMMTTRGIPIQSFRMGLYESDFNNRRQWLFNEEREVRESLKELQQLKESKKEVCKIIKQFNEGGFSGRVRRCIQYVG